MKAIFGALLCLVLTSAESFAISGGPMFTKATSIIGTYGGVLQGVFDLTNPSSSNTIGVFSSASQKPAMPPAPSSCSRGTGV